MITSMIYRNKWFYYHLMEGFLDQKITPVEFQEQFWTQRGKDLNKNKEIGRTYEYYENMINNLTDNEKKFRESWNNPFSKDWSSDYLAVMKEYERGANALDIKGEIFFKGIWSFIEEYTEAYAPSDAGYDFDPKLDVDEKTLYESTQAAFDVLERNKDRWADDPSDGTQEDIEHGRDVQPKAEAGFSGIGG